MLPEGSLLMMSNLTPRNGKHANFLNAKGIVSMGQQKTVRQMNEDWSNNFFNKPNALQEIEQFSRDMTDMLMLAEPYDVSHFIELYNIGYLPIEIRGIEEGTFIPYKVPMLTIVNTQDLSHKAADWIVNYLETILSAESWQSPTSATLGLEFQKLGAKWINITDPESMWFLDYQFHDFSMRGMGGKSAIINSGLGFAATSRGSDTLPVIPAARKYYDEVDVCINSVMATEHAIMCSLTGFYLLKKDGSWDKIGEIEVETFRELLRRFPSGILSIVSDTWDLWRVLTEYMVTLKDEILARNGKLVIRPDSGDPVDIITGTFANVEDLTGDQYCPTFEAFQITVRETILEAVREDTPHGEMGPTDWSEVYKYEGVYYKCTVSNIEWNRMDKQYYYMEQYSPLIVTFEPIELTPAQKGVIQLLDEIFGHDITSTGYKRLNSKVGAIYGDSINMDRATRIFERLAAKGYASTNIVLGIGSFSLQFVTRDSHGIAQKATYIEVKVDDQVHGIEIFKDPITDDGVKKSARGLVGAFLVDGVLTVRDQLTWEEFTSEANMLKPIYVNGEFFNQTTLTKIRANIKAQL